MYNFESERFHCGRSLISHVWAVRGASRKLPAKHVSYKIYQTVISERNVKVNGANSAKGIFYMVTTIVQNTGKQLLSFFLPSQTWSQSLWIFLSQLKCD